MDPIKAQLWVVTLGVVILLLALRALTQILVLLRFWLKVPEKAALRQIGGFVGVPKGGSGLFQMQGTPAGTQFPSGTKFDFSVDDTAEITLSASTDGDPSKVNCSASASAAQSSFILTCVTDFTPPGASGPIQTSVTVPITVPTPTGGQIVQLS